MKIQTVIRKMLTEPCGRRLCDSGCYFGYQWERRAKKDLDMEPVCSIEWNVWKDGTLDGIITKSLYHHMCEYLVYESKLTRELNKFFRKQGEEPCVNTDMFEKWVESMKDYKVVGSDNTYNYDNILDGCFCFTHFIDCWDDTCDYFVICTHNGADVRGGYSRPKVFNCREYYNFLAPIAYLDCGNACSEFETDSTTFRFDKGDWSEHREEGKPWFKDGKLYCPDCGCEMVLTC